MYMSIYIFFNLCMHHIEIAMQISIIKHNFTKFTA